MFSWATTSLNCWSLWTEEMGSMTGEQDNVWEGRLWRRREYDAHRERERGHGVARKGTRGHKGGKSDRRDVSSGEGHAPRHLPDLVEAQEQRGLDPTLVLRCVPLARATAATTPPSSLQLEHPSRSHWQRCRWHRS